MYIETIPNRNSPPAILLREGYRENGKVVKRTLANLSHWDAQLVENFRILLKGGVAVASAASVTSNAIPRCTRLARACSGTTAKKLHIGVDSRSGLAHSAVVTPANVHDKHPIPQLLHGAGEWRRLRRSVPPTVVVGIGVMKTLLRRVSRTWTTRPTSPRAWRALLVLLLVAVGYLALIPTPLVGSDSSLDKVGHLLAFTALAFSGYLGFPSSRGTRTAVLIGLLVYGGLIEVMQLFVPGRTAEWGDLLADGIGIVFGIGLAAFVLRFQVGQ